MRNLKKFLALVLAMVMAFSLMVTANAAHAGTQYNDEDTVTPAFSEAVEVLTGMGIFQGDSGSFRPASNITRAEVAAIIYRLVTGDTGNAKKDLYTTQHPFTDVRPDAWYAGYVGYLHNAKIIKGTTATTFNPTGNVTGYEVLAMILRAVGYDKNDEFTGGTWRVEVASTATNLGILQDVNSTHYGDTLHLASRRDVVASLLFRTAAYVPMVQYTLAFGYQDTGMNGGVTGSTKNPTLGQKYFNLARTTGIVVGNPATGENCIKVSQQVYDSNINTVTGASYQYESKQDSANPIYGSLVDEFSLKDKSIGLEFFGHKVNVWYNWNSSKSLTYTHSDSREEKYRSGFSAYAVVDKATMDKVVFANEADFTATGTNVITLLDAAKGAGFSANVQSTAYISDRYSQFSTVKYGSKADIVASKVGMYRLISNNGTGVDVVVSLNQEVAQITQVNTTINGGEYIYLGTGGSGFGDELVTGSGNEGLILMNQLSAASVKALGTLVTAHQIVGTTNTFIADANDHTYANANAMAPKYARYQTDKLEPSMTGTIATYRVPDGKNNVSSLTLTDGTVLNLSGITGSDDPFSFDVYEHLINLAVGKLTDINTRAGVTYSFYFDEVGRFIGVTSPTEYSFLYATFADYQIGALGTGTIGYYAYGVDWDGNIVKDKQITSISLPVTAGAFDQASGSRATYPGSGVLAEGYNLLPITMKNQGTVATVGNEIRQGANTRFMMNAAGHMSWYNEGGNYGKEFIGFANNNSLDANRNPIPAISNNDDVTVNDWTWDITSTDVVNGFARVYGATAAANGDQNAYLLTNATKFIVVTGAGTSDLSVKTYNGIGELVGNGSSATISVTWDGENSRLVGDRVYFQTSSDKYGNVDTSDNATIDTVILSDSNLNKYGAQSLFFAAPGATATGVKLAGNTDSNINQYKLYSGGQVGYYWVKDDAGVAAGGTAAVGSFYQLTPIDTVNGQTIYRAVPVTGGNVAVGATYDYVVVNDMSTAEITFRNGQKQVFKVTGSNVTEAFGANTPVITTNTIDSVLKLNHAVSMGHANASGDLYTVSVAIVFSGINVVDIYVTNIA